MIQRYEAEASMLRKSVRNQNSLTVFVNGKAEELYFISVNIFQKEKKCNSHNKFPVKCLRMTQSEQ